MKMMKMPVFNKLSFKKAIYEVHAHRVWAQMVQWRFLPIFLLIYSVVPLCNCILPSDKTSNLGISLQSFYTFSFLQEFILLFKTASQYKGKYLSGASK